MEQLTEIFGEVIHKYTRVDAIRDGTLIDVSETAKEAGFKIPVAVTQAVWADCVAVPRGLEGMQDESGRLWDVLFMLHHAIKFKNEGGDAVFYALYVARDCNNGTGLTYLKALIHPGDDHEPVITIMQPDED